jgi:cation transport regulator
MPYQANDDLLPKIKNVLPEHAQDIYRAAFNHAWDEYKAPDKRKTFKTQEQGSP